MECIDRSYGRCKNRNSRLFNKCKRRLIAKTIDRLDSNRDTCGDVAGDNPRKIVIGSVVTGAISFAACLSRKARRRITLTTI